MAEAIRLAARGRDGVSPNPMVGAVVARGGRIVGRGFHRRFGGPHAEVEALREAGRRARGAHLYVTLEPCAHRGKTGPCTEAIIGACISRVTYAAPDPNPATRGRGPSVLREAGIEVDGGLLEDAARDLNRPYYHWRETGRPWTILKWAMTLDGKIATRTGESRWITSEAARAEAHRLRRRADGILVGTGTLLRDDPHLLPRPSRGRTPVRIALDRKGRLPLGLRFFDPAPPQGKVPGAARPVPDWLDPAARRIYVVGPGASSRRRREVAARGIKVIAVPEAGGLLCLPALLDSLGAAGIGQLLVEGGGELIGSFLDEGLAQEAAVFVAPLVFGGAGAPGPAGGEGIARLADALRLESPAMRRVGPDVLIAGRIGR